MVKALLYCRVRPPIGDEDRVVFAVPDTSSVKLLRGEEYHYHGVFGEKSGHAHVFETVYGDMSDAVSSGRDCMVLLYGPTKAGKTTTLRGTIGRFIESVCPADLTATEFYNGKQTTLVSGRVDDAAGGTALVKRALERRSTAATSTNQESSRSHLFLSFRRAGGSLLTLVDLAGSERLSQTGDEPMRVAEAIHVNRSLSALRDVVDGLATNKSYVPYRNSALTMFLKTCLRHPDSVLALVLCCNHHLAQSADTLKFGRTATKMNRCPPPVHIEQQEEEEESDVDYKKAWEDTQKELEIIRQQLRKRPVCSRCGEPGHNKRTCTAAKLTI